MDTTPQQSDTALALKPVETTLTNFEQFVKGIEVKTKDDYKRVGEAIVRARNNIKAIGFILDPGILSAKEHLDTLKNAKANFVDKWKEQIAVGEKKAEAWVAEERRLASVETERINAENRRAAQQKADDDAASAKKLADDTRRQRLAEIERDLAAGKIGKREAQRQMKAAGAEAEAAKLEAAAAAEDAKSVPVALVQAEPDVPKVAGIKRRVNWKFKVVDETKVPRIWCTPNLVRIGDQVRATKDKQIAEALIPGIEVWDEDSV